MQVWKVDADLLDFLPLAMVGQSMHWDGPQLNVRRKMWGPMEHGCEHWGHSCVEQYETRLEEIIIRSYSRHCLLMMINDKRGICWWGRQTKTKTNKS